MDMIKTEEIIYSNEDKVEMDPPFKETSILEQLGKIIDSASIVVDVEVPRNKYRPVNTVKTDDGDEIIMSVIQAEKMKELILKVPVKYRLYTLKRVQTTAGLSNLLQYVSVK
jgi:hypothetical protein